MPQEIFLFPDRIFRKTKVALALLVCHSVLESRQLLVVLVIRMHLPLLVPIELGLLKSMRLSISIAEGKQIELFD